MDAVSLGGFANYSAEKLAVLCFASVRSARRWKQTGFAPALVVAWLELTHYGALNRLALAWDGWRIREGALHAPNSYQFSPTELQMLPLLHQELSALRRECMELREKLTRPTPPTKAPCARSRRKSLTQLLRPFGEDEHAPSR